MNQEPVSHFIHLYIWFYSPKKVDNQLCAMHYFRYWEPYVKTLYSQVQEYLYLMSCNLILGLNFTSDSKRVPKFIILNFFKNKSKGRKIPSHFLKRNSAG